jgi:hypothetical protein
MQPRALQSAGGVRAGGSVRAPRAPTLDFRARARALARLERRPRDRGAILTGVNYTGASSRFRRSGQR